MYKYIIKDTQHNILFESLYSYSTKQDAKNAGLDHIDTWEAINNIVGIIEVIEVK